MKCSYVHDILFPSVLKQVKVLLLDTLPGIKDLYVPLLHFVQLFLSVLCPLRHLMKGFHVLQLPGLCYFRFVVWSLAPFHQTYLLLGLMKVKSASGTSQHQQSLLISLLSRYVVMQTEVPRLKMHYVPLVILYFPLKLLASFNENFFFQNVLHSSHFHYQ